MTRKLQEVVSDIIIGSSDGLTVPFALAAGLSSAHNLHFVILGGLSEVSAGMISMGAGAWQAATAENDIEGDSSCVTCRSDAIKSGITVGLSYAIAGLVPLVAYMVCNNAIQAEIYSIISTLLVLFIFGVIKGRFTKQNIWKSGIQTLVIGGLSAGVAFLTAKFIG